jgi:hypothetical protein
MNPILPKQPRVRLDPASYERLRQQVLQRDGWRCQCCGARSNLEVHHKVFRSQGGQDSEENLITVCAECHAFGHGCGRSHGLGDPKGIVN